MRLLGNVAQAALEANEIAAHISAVEQNFSRCRLDEARQHLHGRRFARSIGTQIAGDFAGRYREVHVVDDIQSSIALGQISNFERSHRFASAVAAVYDRRFSLIPRKPALIERRYSKNL